jgi:hypothetical protein
MPHPRPVLHPNNVTRRHLAGRPLAVGATIGLCISGVVSPGLLVADDAADPVTKDTLELPADVAPRVPANHRPIHITEADLDGDGRQDVLLVTEAIAASPDAAAVPEQPRSLLLLRRGADGRLSAWARNDRVVHCAQCGGMMGDPFVGIEAGPRRFTVSHYGGSAWRWGVDVTFAYSRRFDAMQLVEVSETEFHATAPEDATSAVSRPPKDFGRIDFAEFDPEHWRGQGVR